MRLYLLAVLLLAGPAPAISDDLEDSFQKLKEAEAKRDVVLVKKLAAETCDLVRKLAAEPAPESEADKQYWTKHLAYLRDIEVATEYSLFATALKATPAETVDLLETLEKQNPKSKYLDSAYGPWLVALNQIPGGAAKVTAVADRGLKNFPENEDLLLVVADNALNRKQLDRALTCAERAIVVLSKHPKPEGMSAGEWERKRTLSLGRSRWIAGIVHVQKSQEFEADKDLRAALPLIQDNEAMRASALFYLGLANYQIGSVTLDKSRILQAANFSEQAAAIKGPLSQQAWSNAQSMRLAAGKMR